MIAFPVPLVGLLDGASPKMLLFQYHLREVTKKCRDR